MATNYDPPFAATFPLPFRVMFLAGMGVLGWATNLHGLEALGIDAAKALDLRSPSSSRAALPSHRSPGFRLIPQATTLWDPLYRLLAVYSLWCFIAWALFRLATRESMLIVDVFRYIPAITGLGVATALVCPFDVLYKRERDMFLQCVAHCPPRYSTF